MAESNRSVEFHGSIVKELLIRASLLMSVHLKVRKLSYTIRISNASRKCEHKSIEKFQSVRINLTLGKQLYQECSLLCESCSAASHDSISHHSPLSYCPATKLH